ncbi:hypothetical protein DOE76_18070 [Leifsonia sp. ku-ls]|nr:hypothetical protein DOE76_18070 [Leifsonia sp. ku-ls]
MKKPSQRTWIITGLAAAALIAAGAFTLSQLPAPVARTASSTVASHPSAPSGGSSDADDAGQIGGAPATPGAGNTPPAAGKRYTTEVQPAAPAATPALPKSAALPYPIAAPLPKTASASGKLVDGYPAKVIPQVPGSKVGTSSVASEDTHLQVTLDASTDQKVNDIVAFYRSKLAAYGMYDAAAPAVAGATSVQFARDGNSVTLTVTPGDKGTSYVLFGAFTTKG